MSILAKFIEYSKNPTIETNYVVKNKFWEILKLSSVVSLISLVLSFIIQLVASFFGYDFNGHFLTSLVSTESSLYVFYLVCIQAPIIEELEFRLILRPNIRNIVVSVWLLLNELIFFNLFKAFEFNNLVPIIFYIINFLVLCYWLFERDSKKIKSTIAPKYYKHLYYLSIILFALGHFANYMDNSIWFLLPILVLPQFISGFSLSFIRMHFGLKWSILFHAVENFVIIFPILICKEAAIEIYESISDSKQIVPDLIYTLPLSNQFFYLSGVAISVIFILFGIYMSFLGIKEYFEYKKSLTYVE